jgi:hypothetical protein
MQPPPTPPPPAEVRYAPRRIRGIALVLAGVVVCLLASHIVLDAALGAEPSWLIDEAPLDWRYYQRFGKQIAGAEWELEHRPRQFPKRFGVLIGASTIQLGPLPALVEEQTGYPWLLLGVGGGPTAIQKIQRSLHLLENAGLHPDTLVLGMHPLWLPSGAPPSEDEPTPVSGLWYLKNQKPVSNLLYTGMQSARERIASWLGFGSWMAFTPAADPWHPKPERPLEVQQPEEMIVARRQRDAAAGRYDPTRYERDGRPVRDLSALVRKLEAVCDHMIIALLPEQSWHREHMPEVAARLLIESVAGSSPTPPPIIDLRDTMRDEWFVDSYHLTMTGRRKLSELLGQRITQASAAPP